MPDEHWTDDYVLMISDCEARESQLTEWEGKFIDSLSDQLSETQNLSPKQIQTLEDVWDRVTG